MLGYVWDIPDAISGEPIYEESFVVAGRPDALPDAPRIDLETYCAADHVLISPEATCAGW